MQGGPFVASLPVALRRLVDVMTSSAPHGTIAVDEEIVELACAEELAPLLGAVVGRGQVTVPASRREELMRAHQMCLASNLLRRRLLQTMMELFGPADIPLVLLKGMALIQSVIPTGERSMGDVDVLVPASRWREACDLLSGSGFTETVISGRRFTADHDYVRSFSSPAGAMVEIHRFVCEASYLRIDYEGRDGLFARARRTPAEFSLPDDGDLFLTLAAHAAKHTFDLPLRSFLDGIFLLRRRALSIPALAARARGWGMEVTFEMWMRALRALVPELDGASAAPAFEGSGWWWLGRFVWSHTNHASPWQRFVRMAWLVDGGSEWARHVGTRAGFRTLDALQTMLAADGGAARSRAGG
ncbi:MAG TPA: nucleotidyltransferase family protein [Polyangia bacterium]|jgi:hypothetical protein